MFSFFRKKPPPAPPAAPESTLAAPASPSPAALPVAQVAPEAVRSEDTSASGLAPTPAPAPAARASWLTRLTQGLRNTGSGIAQVFTGVRIDDALYEQLEEALLMADAGMPATQALLEQLKRRVKDTGAKDVAAVKALLVDVLTDALQPLERILLVDERPTVMMVVGVNGAGKTTSIGKLTRHLAEGGCKVLLAAADTFRAAAREQLQAWAVRVQGHDAVQSVVSGAAQEGLRSATQEQVQIISQEGADPAAVVFDTVSAGRARGVDVVIADTAGRLPTQAHLMEELKKIQRVIGKAQAGAPHEVILVVDGNTGQNALAQVKTFHAALSEGGGRGLTGLIVTKLDGTAKGGVLAAIARWGVEQAQAGGAAAAGQTGVSTRVRAAVPVYFIGVGEQLEDLQPFNAREFAQALLQ